jgi:hypothetical protein
MFRLAIGATRIEQQHAGRRGQSHSIPQGVRRRFIRGGSGKLELPVGNWHAQMLDQVKIIIDGREGRRRLSVM